MKTDLEILQVRDEPQVVNDILMLTGVVDRESIIKLLNDSLATELVCVLRYRRQYFMTQSGAMHGAATAFLNFSNAKMEHADQLARRVVQLGGDPDFAPGTLLSRSHTDYKDGNSLASMLHQDLVAECTMIAAYRNSIQSLRNSDHATSSLLEQILSVKEKNADDLADLMVLKPVNELMIAVE